MALTDSLVAYWKLDEASGPRADSHGSNTLTDNNTVASAAGKVATAGDFEFSNQEYLSRADNADLSTGDIDFTLQAWVRLESETADGYSAIMGKWGAAGGREYLLYYLNGVGFSFSVSSNGTNPTDLTSGFGTQTNGTWYLIHAWHDAANNQLGISVNAGTPTTTSYSAGVFDSGSEFVIGRNTGGGPGGYFDGLIDEVGFWKRVLTSGERTQLYNGGSGLAYPLSTGVTVTPAAAAAKAAAVAPSVRLGSVSVAVSAAVAKATGVNPTVRLGSVSVAPAAAAAKATAAAPTVRLGSLSITPAVAAAKAAAVAPTVRLGSVSVTPSAAAAKAACVAPTVRLGSVSVTPAAAAARALGVAPTVVSGGDVLVAPAAAAAKAAGVNPTVRLGSLTVTPAAGPARALATDPFVRLGSLSVTPTRASARALAVAPTVVLGAVVPPAASAKAAAVAPTVRQGSFATTPAAAAARCVGVGPTVRLGSTTAAPAAAVARAAGVDPTVTVAQARNPTRAYLAGTDTRRTDLVATFPE